MSGDTIPTTETLTIEFKSDRNRLRDSELVEAVVCLANTEGGTIFPGVEDDGHPTGLHADHQQLEGLPALIANRTRPAVVVRVERIEVHSVAVARIVVPKMRQIIATADGTMKRRQIGADGRPECVPLLPQEIPSRLSDLGLLDPSSQPVPGAILADLDPAERARIRQFAERYTGDSALLSLSDEELEGALGLVVRNGAERSPTLAGLLLIGKESALRRLVPTHEVAFQVLEGEEVRLNEFSNAPLLRIFERLEALLLPLNPEQEIQVGLFRVSVPRIDRRAFREALANDLVHRDYTRTGAAHVRFESDALVVSNPGGFVEGVTQDNLLTTEPRPRNRSLADALKRIGIVERTGRGVDLIYRGLLRYGRPGPDYSRSNPTSVVLRMPAADPDLAFLRLIVEEENRRQSPLPIDSLIALSCLRKQRRLSSDELAAAIQKDRSEARATLERLTEAGFVEPHGHTRARTYTLARGLYAEQGAQTAYTRQIGIETSRQEELVLAHARNHGSVKRADVMELCHLGGDQAYYLLTRLVEQGRLVREGKKRGTWYHLPGDHK